MVKPRRPWLESRTGHYNPRKTTLDKVKTRTTNRVFIIREERYKAKKTEYSTSITEKNAKKN